MGIVFKNLGTSSIENHKAITNRQHTLQYFSLAYKWVGYTHETFIKQYKS